MSAFEGISNKAKIALVIAGLIMFTFFAVETCIVFGIFEPTYFLASVGYVCIIAFMPAFFIVVLEFLQNKKVILRQIDNQVREMEDFRNFVEVASLVSKADKYGKITFVNKKFEEVSGWTLEEVLGKDHSVVNSGTHPKEFWNDMYKTVVADKEIWNAVCTNKAKDGSIYHVDTFIKGEFDNKGKLTGFMSIRQDVTELKRKEVEISNKMVAINRSNAVIEFDLQGNIKFANDLFLETLGYSSSEEIVGKHHSIFIEDELIDTQEYANFWEGLKSGAFFSGEITRKKKDGKLIYLQATYNPIIGFDGKIYRVLKIATDISTSINQQKEIAQKNTYLEHASKIIRHDMHSGINTYLPRGIKSLKRRLTKEQIEELKLQAPLQLIEDGLTHAQKVYSGVYEFTNLVKSDTQMTLAECNIRTILEDYLRLTAYKGSVLLDDSLSINMLVNEALFCTAIDNLIRNGLRYNDSETKCVKIYLEDNYICVEDNGRGITQNEFIELSKPYKRRAGQIETGTGLGLNICTAILTEHEFTITAEKINPGTKLKIKIK
jgi:PAS domain S-box-containing protein